MFNCPPAAFTYTSTVGGVELIQYNGEGAAADNVTINGTSINDTTILNPTGTGTGAFVSGLSPMFEFKSFDFTSVRSGTGGFDRVQVDGTEGPDVVTSTATTVLLIGAVEIGAGIDQLDINTYGGNDNVDLDLAVAGLAKFVNVGAGNDTVNLLGVAVDPADPTVYGGDGDDVIIGSPNADAIFGGKGNDILVGAGGVDQIYGEEGNDILGNPGAVANGVADDGGNDFLSGGDGSDLFVWNQAMAAISLKVVRATRIVLRSSAELAQKYSTCLRKSVTQREQFCSAIQVTLRSTWRVSIRSMYKATPALMRTSSAAQTTATLVTWSLQQVLTLIPRPV